MATKIKKQPWIYELKIYDNYTFAAFAKEYLENKLRVLGVEIEIFKINKKKYGIRWREHNVEL